MRRRTRPSRRGAVLAAAALVLIVLNLAVVASVGGAGDDERVAARRLETLRAFLAAEGGASIVIGELTAGRDAPEDPLALPAGGTAEITVTGDPTPERAEILGHDGQARRRVVLTLE